MGTPANVLIIDDDPDTCETLGNVLQLKGHAVQTATCGHVGLERLGPSHVDAAIVDIVLPDISGLDLLDAIKVRSPETEVIFITGNASLGTAMQAMNGAAFAYFVKPVEIDHLLATLDKALEKQRLARALRESESRYRLIAESIMDALFLSTSDGRVVFWNKRSEQLTGLMEGELGGRQLFSLLGADGASQIRARIEDGGAGSGASSFFETEIIRADGRRVWVEANVARVVHERVVGYLLVARDITARKQLQERLLQAEKLSAMGQLLAGVAHELNNPLSIVAGRASLLYQRVGKGPLGDQVTELQHAAQRCARIVGNFLALARQRPTARHSVSLNQVLHEAVELIGYQLRVDDVEVGLDLAADLPAIWGDAHQLHQVVVNLLSNAHYALRDRPRPRRVRITTRFHPARQRVRLEVADTGSGIAPEIRARIFDPFFTTKPGQTGTGLGLALCQGIINGHEGSIEVESEPGRGALFRIDLPVAEGLVGEMVGPATAVSLMSAGKVVLVVDDERAIGGMLADVLATDGHRVEFAENGLIALDKLQERSFDCILSDVRMPGLDGPGLYREMEQRHPDLLQRVIFITGDALSPEVSDLIDRTGVPCVTKPFSVDEVRRVVQEAIEPSGAGGEK